MGFTDKTRTHDYTSSDWQAGKEHGKTVPSVWTFRAEKSSDDDEQVQAKTTRQITRQIDRQKFRRAVRIGDTDTVEQIMADANTTEIVMSTRTALLEHMSVSWSGPEFTLPKTYGEHTDSEGKKAYHPLAGTVPPCEAEWIGLRDGFELDDILTSMQQIWAGRSQAEQEQFPGGSDRVD